MGKEEFNPLRFIDKILMRKPALFLVCIYKFPAISLSDIPKRTNYLISWSWAFKIYKQLKELDLVDGERDIESKGHPRRIFLTEKGMKVAENLFNIIKTLFSNEE